MTTLNKNASEIRNLIENGVTKCPSGYDPATWDIILEVVKSSNVEDVPFDVVDDKAATVQQNSTALATVSGNGSTTQVAAPLNGQAFGLDDFEASTNSTAGWISVSNGIVSVGGEPIDFPSEGLKAVFLGHTVKFYKGIRVSFGTTYKYYKTMDGVKTTTGENWADIVNAAANECPDSYVYNLIEATLRLEQPVTKGKTVVLDAGEEISYSNSPSAAKLVRAFSDEVKKSGKTIIDGEIPVTLVLEQFSNKTTKKPYYLIAIKTR